MISQRFTAWLVEASKQVQTFEIYTIGNAYFLDKIFNAIKIVCSGDYGFILKIASAASIFLISLKAGLTSDFKQAMKWCVGVIVLVSLFLGTKARVVINDQLPDGNGRMQAAYIVDDVPWGLAVIGEVTSKVGKTVMDKFESAFAGVTNNQSYRKYGILFGSKVIEDANRIRVSNSDLRSFITTFYKQCIIPDLKMGHARKNGYTIQELASSEDVGSFLKDHASRARRIFLSGTITKTVKKEGFLGDFLGSTEQKTSTIDGYVSCNEAASYIYDMIENEVQNNKFKLSSSFIGQFADHKMAPEEKNRFYEAVLVDTYGAFLKSSKEASEILKQNVIINSLKDASANVANSYAQIATEEMTKSSMYSISQVFQKFIPIIRAIFECTFYGVAPLVFILMVTPMGLEVLKNYAFSFVYLQMWPPMYAILYTIMENWSRFSASGLKHNMESLPQIGAINYDISMVSGYMLALIPVLSFFVTKGLVASVGNMATSMMYIPQTAAVQTSDQSVKGNYQFGSTSMDNHSYDNLSAHKHDDNYSWMSGMKSFSMASGAMSKESSTGHKMLDMSSGLSNLGNQVSINWNKAMGKRFDESESMVQREMESSSQDYVESTSSGLSKMLGYDQNFSKGTSANKAIERGLSSEQREAMDYVKGVTNKVAQETGMSYQDALKFGIGANAGVNFGAFGISAGINGGVDASSTTIKDGKTSVGEQIAEDKKFQESLGMLTRLGRTTTSQTSDSVLQSQLNSMRSDFNQSEVASLKYSMALENSRSLQENRNNYRNNSHNMDVNFSQKFADYGINRYGEEKFERMLRSDPESVQLAAQTFLAQETNFEEYNFKQIGLGTGNSYKKNLDKLHESYDHNQQMINIAAGGVKFEKDLSKGFQEAYSQTSYSLSDYEKQLANDKEKIEKKALDIGKESQEATNSLALIEAAKRITNQKKGNHNE